jgi:hypothetical protein
MSTFTIEKLPEGIMKVTSGAYSNSFTQTLAEFYADPEKPKINVNPRDGSRINMTAGAKFDLDLEKDIIIIDKKTLNGQGPLEEKRAAVMSALLWQQ